MKIKFVFLKKASLPNLYRYLYFKINDVEFISFYKFTRINENTGKSRSQTVLQLFNREIGRINYWE